MNGLVQECSISIANALEILQCCTKPAICDMQFVFLYFVILECTCQKMNFILLHVLLILDACCTMNILFWCFGLVYNGITVLYPIWHVFCRRFWRKRSSSLWESFPLLKIWTPLQNVFLGEHQATCFLAILSLILWLIFMLSMIDIFQFLSKGIKWSTHWLLGDVVVIFCIKLMIFKLLSRIDRWVIARKT